MKKIRRRRPFDSYTDPKNVAAKFYRGRRRWPTPAEREKFREECIEAMLDLQHEEALTMNK